MYKVGDRVEFYIMSEDKMESRTLKQLGGHIGILFRGKEYILSTRTQNGRRQLALVGNGHAYRVVGVEHK